MEFEEIYRACFKSVYQYVRRLSGNEHIAEEVTSDTFFKALKSIDRFRGECDMRVWLCQIARNTYYLSLIHISPIQCTVLNTVTTHICNLMPN